VLYDHKSYTSRVKLVITEKPSVARDIARVLNVTHKKEGVIEGNGWVITWALGHLIEFVQPDEYGDAFKEWRMDQLPILPNPFKTKPIERTLAQYQTVISQLRRSDITSVVCATDAGREGELIFRLIYEAAQCEYPIQRLWISSQTDAAIREGFGQLKDGSNYRALYDSARCRAEADWMVGINATRAYSIKFSRGRGVMSVGRVQTPVLKMIVERYREHHQFKSEPFYELFLELKHTSGNFQVKWFSSDTDRLTDKSQATALSDALKKETQAQIKSLHQKKITEKQPLLYDLTELQKDANKQFKFSADQTLKLMQELYERFKILSYPRTSSRYLSSDIAPKCPELLAKISGLTEFESTFQLIKDNNYTIAKRMIDDKKVTDHHAIIPTDKSPNLGELTGDHKRIYLMVIRRFLMAFLPECEKSHTEIVASAANETFKVTGTVILADGWRRLSTEEKKDDVLPSVSKDECLPIETVILKKGQTKAPALYNEASILGAMETAGKKVDDDELRQAMKDCGLGTPATRAQILEKLISVRYIERVKNRLLPTAKGEYLIDCMLSESLTSPELTGEWEKALNNMAKSKEDRGEYMKKIKMFTKDVIKKVAENTSYTIGADQKIYGTCPKCSVGKIIETPKAYSCTEWKSTQCSFAIWKEMAQKKITATMVKSLLKSGETAVIKGFKNKQGKPFEAALCLTEGEVKFNFKKESLGACPLCEKGQVVETLKSFSCDQWQALGCKFVIWKMIASREISKSDAITLIEKKELNDLNGFKRKTGEEFSASLVLLNNTSVQFKPR
jgi:DNA topoisomerase-3